MTMPLNAGAPLTPERVRSVAYNYTTYKHSGLAKAPRQYNETNPSAIISMQRALELPKAAGRKVGQLLTITHGIRVNNYIDALKKTDAEPILIESLDELQRLDNNYTNLIASLVAKKDFVSVDELRNYNEWLTTLYPKIINLGILATSGFIRYIDKL